MTIPSRRASRFGGRSVLFLYTAAIVYASLNPFYGWRLPEAVLLLTWPRYWSGFDVVLNVLAYIPFGALVATDRLAGLPAAWRAREPRHAVLVAWLAALALSTAMELAQTLLPQRVCSPLDVITNTLGAFIGALAVTREIGRDALAVLLRWRARWVRPGRTVTAGLLLLGAWLFAQTNPLVPLFDSGQFVNPFVAAQDSDPYRAEVFFPYAAGVAMNVAGFGLFVSLLLRSGRPLFAAALVILGAGFALKVSMAGLMLRAPQLAEWLVPAAVAGVVAGLAAFRALSRLDGRGRALAAALLIFAGGLFARITTEAGAIDTTARLLNWPHGHVLTFAGLTRWVHEVWPLATCAFASALFLRARPLE